MKRIFFLALAVLFRAALPAQTGLTPLPRESSFNADWKFFKGDIAGAETIGFKDAGWRTLDVPHDWSIEDLPGQGDSIVGPFYKNSAGNTSTGYTVGGIGWYRKTFRLNKADTDKKIGIVFDGVYMNSEVWLNGKRLGVNAYGYTPFSFDLTPFLAPAGQLNVIAVRVRNEGQNSRWYTGSGIYRQVTLTATPPLHIDQWGVFISARQATSQRAVMDLQLVVRNPEKFQGLVTLRTILLDKKGREVGRVFSKPGLIADSASIFGQALIERPDLWSPDSPNLYRARTALLVDGKLVDEVVTVFGVRSIRFDARQGFLLNGKKFLLRGGSVHHDNGPLGSKAIDRAEERKAGLLKSFGFNAVRTSHNPPSTSFLNACDKLGLLVIDESFDMWEVGKKPEDYHQSFKEWHKHDLRSIVLRDRNHPSVIAWSIGNEIKEVSDPSGLVIARELRDIVKALDTTRPVTEAICDFWDRKDLSWRDTDSSFSFLDVGGYNYEWKKYLSDHRLFPSRIIIGTESFPQEAYDNWKLIGEQSWLSGDFVWAAMDYMGETAIGHSVLDNEKDGGALEWPWFNAWCGDIDLIGGKKPQSYYRDVLWNIRPIALAVHRPIPEGRVEKVSKWGWPNERQSWTWPGSEGSDMQVAVYSTSPTVRLKLNGKIIGEQRISDTSRLTARFSVPYAPGILEAVGLKEGKEVCSTQLKTVGPSARIRLTPDRPAISRSRNDLSYVKVEIIDADGNLVPDAAATVQFLVSGQGELAAVGTANPTGMQSFQRPVTRTFRGCGLIILRPAGKKGAIDLKAVSDGLIQAVSQIKVL